MLRIWNRILRRKLDSLDHNRSCRKARFLPAIITRIPVAANSFRSKLGKRRHMEIEVKSLPGVFPWKVRGARITRPLLADQTGPALLSEIDRFDVHK